MPWSTEIEIILHLVRVETPYNQYVSVKMPTWISEKTLFSLIEETLFSEKIETKVTEFNCSFESKEYDERKIYLVKLNNPHPDPKYPKPEFDSPAKRKVLELYPSAMSRILANNQQGTTEIYVYYGTPVLIAKQPTEAEAWQYVVDNELILNKRLKKFKEEYSNED